MKNIIIYSIIAVVAGFAGCKKYNHTQQDVAGDGYIRGRLYLLDSFVNQDPLSAGEGVTIYLSQEPEGDNFIYGQLTDKDGYFMFRNLKQEPYYVFAKVIRDSFIYSGRVMVTPDTTNFTFIIQPANESQNSITYVVYDTAGRKVNGCTVCLFGGAGAPSDTACIGSIWNGTTNLSGSVRKLNLPAGTFTVNFKYMSGNTLMTAQKEIVITGSGLRYEEVYLKPYTDNSINSITYTVLDSLGGALPNVTICAFSSFVLGSDSCLNSNWSITSGNNGKARIAGVPNGNYLVFFKLTANGLVLKGRDTVSGLQSTTQYRDTIYLK